MPMLDGAIVLIYLLDLMTKGDKYVEKDYFGEIFNVSIEYLSP